MTQRNSTITGAIKEYGSQLLGFIKRKVSRSEDAEDLLQDVWQQFSRVSNLDEITNVSAWLYQVARNRITDQYRKKKEDSLDDLYYENEEGAFNIKDILLLDDTGNAELRMFKDIFWDELTTGLNELPENQKRVFVLNELEDKTLQEIADMEGEKLKTIISRKGYAVKALRKRLQYLYDELNQ